MTSKNIIIGIIILTAAAIAAYQLAFKGNGDEFEVAKAEMGNIYREVAETGSVKTGDKINLGFKSSGIISRIYVNVGDEVWAGKSLVALDTSGLTIQLEEAFANLGIAKAKLAQLLAGSTYEEIKLAETAVENAEQSLADTQADAQENLRQSYQDALVVLDGSYAKGTNALTVVTSIQRSYFAGGDQEGILMRAAKDRMSDSLDLAKISIDSAKAGQEAGEIKAALSLLKTALETSYDSILKIRDITETLSYKNTISSADKTSLDTEKTNINTALTNVINAQQDIASTKISNETSINDAKAALKTSQNELAIKKAGPRQEDINLYEAQVKQAQAQVNLLKNDIAQTTLKSPVRGKVSKIGKKTGEIIQPSLTESVVTILPLVPYEIEANIYEEDIAAMKAGNLVNIELIALPNKTFKGRIAAIDPAEELKDGVVYYKITIVFEEELPAEVKPGMTADITIIIDSRENVLTVPKDAIFDREEMSFVKAYKNGEVQEKNIETGMTGSDDMVEIISGIQEGEEVILE